MESKKVTIRLYGDEIGIVEDGRGNASISAYVKEVLLTALMVPAEPHGTEKVGRPASEVARDGVSSGRRGDSTKKRTKAREDGKWWTADGRSVGPNHPDRIVDKTDGVDLGVGGYDLKLRSKVEKLRKEWEGLRDEVRKKDGKVLKLNKKEKERRVERDLVKKKIDKLVGGGWKHKYDVI